MLVFSNDADIVRQQLDARLKEDDEYLVCKMSDFVTEFSRLDFFKTFDQAQQFCNDLNQLAPRYEVKEVKTVVQLLNSQLSPEKDVNGLNYFEIDSDDRILMTRFMPSALDSPLNTMNLTNWQRELFKFPINELSHSKHRAFLFNEIQDNKDATVTLRTKIVPELLIADYYIVKHDYPKGMIYEQGHVIQELGIYFNYDDALKDLTRIGNQLSKEEPQSTWELNLVGRYHKKQLEFNYEGVPEVNTGYTVLDCHKVNLPEDQFDLEIRHYPRIDALMTIEERLKVKKDLLGERLIFSDLIGNAKEVSAGFWSKSGLTEVAILQFQLSKYGFSNINADQLNEGVKTGRSFFQIQYQESRGEDTMQYRLHFQKSIYSTFNLEKFEAEIRKPIEINDATVNGVNTKELESRMKVIDWNNDLTNLPSTQTFDAKKIVEDLSKLDPISRAQLKTKYWQDKPWGISLESKVLFYMVSDYHSVKMTFSVNPYDNNTADKAYAILNRRSELIKKLETKFTEVLQSSNKNLTMKENVEYLQETVKYHGFGEKHSDEILKKVESGVKEFQIMDETIFQNRKMDSVLNFRQAENGNYYFNNYRATISHADGKPEAELSQTFYLDKGKGFTLKEAMNLLEGRAVYKEYAKRDNDTYTGWKLIDFDSRSSNGQNFEYRILHDNYGYNIQKALGEIDLKIPANIPSFIDDTIKSLEKGNLKQVELNSGEKIFIAADPVTGKASKLARYDSNMKEITTEIRNVKRDKTSTITDDGNNEDLLGKKSKKKSNDVKSKPSDDLIDKKPNRGKRTGLTA